MEIQKKVVEIDGVPREIKLRLLLPNKTDRRKAKAQIAFRRRREAERKKEKFIKRYYESK
jgi:hypothetical protein